MEYKLYDYQQECVDTVNALPEGSRSVVVLATGLGKTVCCSKFDRMGGKLLILSHREELVYQPKKYFDGYRFGVEKASEHASADDEIVSASVQSLSQDKRLTQFKPDNFSLIVVDEAHHAAAPTYKKILNYFKPKKVIGMTATPKRGDGLTLNDVFNEICFNRDIVWAITNKKLTRIKNRIIQVSEIDLSKVKTVMGDFNASQLSHAIDDEQMYEAVTQTYNRYCLDRHTLIYCLTVKGCQETLKTIRSSLPKKERKKIAMITGTTPSEERQKIEKDFMSGKIKCIINCMVLTEGTDLPIADAIINARPTLNETLYTQIVGRGTRLYPGKDHCLVLDMLPNGDRHLCTAATLAGIDVTTLDKDDEKPFNDEKLVDVFDFADKLKEEEEKKKSPVYIFELQYELLAKTVQRCQEIIEEGIRNQELGKAINNEENNKDELNNLDFGGLRYQLQADDNEKYMIRTGYNDAFYISEPDILGNVSVKAQYKGVWYRTQNPDVIQFDDAIRRIRYKLITDKNNNQNFFWNNSIVTTWKNEPATEKQMTKIQTELNNLGYENQEATVANKYEASIAIEYLLNLKKIQNEQENLLNKIADTTTVNEAPVAEKKQVPLYKDIDEILPKVINTNKPLLLSVSLKRKSFINDFKATNKQKDYLRNLWKQIKDAGAESDCDIEEYIDTFTCNTASETIAMLSHLIKNKYIWASKVTPNNPIRFSAYFRFLITAESMVRNRMMKKDIQRTWKMTNN